MSKPGLFLPASLLLTLGLAAVSPFALPMPGSDVPLTLQTLVLCLGGYALGLARSLVGVVAYLGLGAAGAPVFAGSVGGLEVLRGPTGGYLVGFVAALPALALGRLLLRREHALLQATVAALLAHLVVLALGVFWLQRSQVWTWYRTLEAGFWPFLPGALAKCAVVALLVWGAVALKRRR